jgi:CheY-like chemotaxis protein
MMLEEIPFNLDEEINHTLKLFEPLCDDKEIDLILDISPEVPNKIIGDPFRLRQVISNLLSNAVKFTSEGKITVEVILVEEYSGNLTLQFSISDTGIGIPRDKLDTIFGTYSQVDGSTTRKYGGTGLGTTISKQLVELMNGEIWVESPSGMSNDPEYPGSIFIFTIEAYSNEKIEKEINFGKITRLNQINTLILNDNGKNENQLLGVLKNFGIKPDILSFQNKTIEFLSKRTSDASNGFQLLVIIDKPNFDGFSVARQISDANLSKKFLILLVSENNKQGNFVKSKRLNVDHYLVKPFEAFEIFNIIKGNFINIQYDKGKIPAEINKLQKNIKILLAEDNIINQKVSQAIFKNLGYEIDIAKNGQEAVDLHAKNNYDIIFMDVLMPGMDGIQATLAIKDKNKDIPIIAMTASNMKDDKDKALQSGMNDYITKPVRLETIKRILIHHFSVTSKV